MALSGEIELPPHRQLTLAYILLAADSREAAVALARRYRSLHNLEWPFELARRNAETEIADLGLAPRDLRLAQKLLSLIIYPHHALRAPSDVLGRNRLGQPGLWRYAISGDLPILLVRIRRDGGHAAPALRASGAPPLAPTGRGGRRRHSRRTCGWLRGRRGGPDRARHRPCGRRGVTRPAGGRLRHPHGPHPGGRSHVAPRRGTRGPRCVRDRPPG